MKTGSQLEAPATFPSETVG